MGQTIEQMEQEAKAAEKAMNAWIESQKAEGHNIVVHRIDPVVQFGFYLDLTVWRNGVKMQVQF